jgi:hypothetical protein
MSSELVTLWPCSFAIWTFIGGTRVFIGVWNDNYTVSTAHLLSLAINDDVVHRYNIPYDSSERVPQIPPLRARLMGML